MLQNFALKTFPDENVVDENMAASITARAAKSSTKWEKYKLSNFLAFTITWCFLTENKMA